MRRFLSGHLRIGPVTIYGRNAMHWGVTIHTKTFGFLCFRLPLPCFGKWQALYFYASPNGTPWAATFMLGKRHSRRDWALSRARHHLFGHNFNVEEHYVELRKLNDSL